MSNSLLGFTNESVLNKCQWGRPQQGSFYARVLVIGRAEKFKESLLGQLPAVWQSRKELQSQLMQKYAGLDGPVWVVKIDPPPNKQHQQQFQLSPYTMARDVLGAVFREVQNFENVQLTYLGRDEDEFRGAIVGFEMAQYRFRMAWPKPVKSQMNLFVEAPSLKTAKKVFAAGKTLGEAVNVARHLVNLPPNVLNPKTYANFAKEVFKGGKVKVEVWDMEKLRKENMHLHVAVGQAAEEKPCLVRLSYRGAGAKQKPTCFVGKGITFDSGGLDIKPAAGMREMKKDMGGSAAVLGLCYWMVKTSQKFNADFYLPLAENSVSDESFRPGDILSSRLGKTVEIHNTDAEGRLVLADSLALAQEGKPECLIDVATLTGAVKVAMGENTPGLFSNDDKLAQRLLKAGSASGDNCWRLPLDPGQRSKLKSEVADFANAHEGFGGAVTAALFLEAFVGGVPWAHLDIYAWTGSASGALSERGGSGQMVQCLAEFCQASKNH